MYPPFNLSMSPESHDYGLEDDFIVLSPEPIPADCVVISFPVRKPS